MSNLNSIPLLGVVLAALLLTSQTVAHERAADLVQAALVHGDRPAADAEQDARRMPLEVLAFAGIRRGMAVFEMEAGGGWYTEILSRTVGSTGSVIMQNPPSFDSFFGEGPAERAARLGNVQLSRTNFDELAAPDNSIDMVTWILGPHELWYQPEEGVTLGDPAATFAEIHRILKPGGVFLAIDHRAAPDSGPEVGGTLHRIREDIIVDHAEAAGLSVLRTSMLFRNEDDPLDISVFDPSIQGRTDKFVVLFRK